MRDFPRRRVDALVIGAGAAGLAAARTLSQRGKTVILVEARQRIGGRICTLHDERAALPIELGAEFVHGEAAATFKLVKAARLVVDQLPDDHFRSRDGKIAHVPQFWEKIGRVVGTLARQARKTRAGDRSFADAIERADVPSDIRELVVDFIEGYHAADPHKISATFLDQGEDDDAGNKQFRIVSGTDALVRWLQAGLDPDRVTVRTTTIASRLRWKKGEVTLWCRNAAGASLSPFTARTAIISVPHAVLKAKGLTFDPAIPAKEAAIDRLETGHVFKIVLQFRASFWEEDRQIQNRLQAGRQELSDLNFVHAHDADVPTWWTPLPARAPIVTGWAGGPRAERILREDETTRVDLSLTALAHAFAMPRRRLDELIDGWWSHDWQADPFSRGAYTYPQVGGLSALQALARPVGGTLFFAGEATDPSQTATVAGAIDSGRRAANQVLRTLGG